MASLGDFSFPRIFSFPPFFTLQPVVSTRSKQVATWCELILAYARHYNIYVMDVREVSNSPLFVNASLNRRLLPEAILEVLDRLVSNGGAEWLPLSGGTSIVPSVEGPRRLLLWWRSQADWAATLKQYVDQRGLHGSVATLYELREGDDALSTDFHGMAPEALERIVRLLEAQGQARLFYSQQGDLGVKFS